MNENERFDLSDRELEAAFRDAEIELPDGTLKEVNPWKKAMKFIVVGFCLGTFTLNFFGLQYILPSVGALLSFFGFRSLRKENRGFKVGFVLCVFRALRLFSSIVLGAYAFRNGETLEPVLETINYLDIALGVIELAALCVGVNEVRKKADENEKSRFHPAGLLIWYIALCVLAVLELSDLLVVIAMVVLFVLVLRSFLKLVSFVGNSGYSIKPAPVRVPNGVIAGVTAALLVLGVVCLTVFTGSYSMDWKKALPASESEEVLEIKNRLVLLGFPEEVLDDLTEDDILACKGARKVIVQSDEIPFNDGRTVTKTSKDGFSTSSRTVYDAKELKMTGIAVKLGKDFEDEYGNEGWKVFHHFVWLENPKLSKTECIEIAPAYRSNGGEKLWGRGSDFSGRVLCEENGETYSSPYYSLRNGFDLPAGTGSYDFSRQENIFAELSFPKDGEKRRGYISYTALGERKNGFDSQCSYTVQKTLLRYPATTAKEYTAAKTIFTADKTFRTGTSALQF